MASTRAVVAAVRAAAALARDEGRSALALSAAGPCGSHGRRLDGEANRRWTQRTPHYVLSTALDKVDWETARLMRDVSELRSLKGQPGGAIYVIGGAALVSSLMNDGLIDELRLIVHPIILGGGKAPFAGVKDRQTLELVQSHLP